MGIFLRVHGVGRMESYGETNKTMEHNVMDSVNGSTTGISAIISQ